MSTSYEKRHLPDILAFHQRRAGFTVPAPSIESDLLLEDDPGDASSKMLLESDAGAGTDILLLQDST